MQNTVSFYAGCDVHACCCFIVFIILFYYINIFMWVSVQQYAIFCFNICMFLILAYLSFSYPRPTQSYSPPLLFSFKIQPNQLSKTTTISTICPFLSFPKFFQWNHLTIRCSCDWLISFLSPHHLLSQQDLHKTMTRR